MTLNQKIEYIRKTASGEIEWDEQKIADLIGDNEAEVKQEMLSQLEQFYDNNPENDQYHELRINNLYQLRNSLKQRRQKVIQKRFRTVSKVAASILVLISLGFIARTQYIQTHETVQYCTISTPLGSKSNVTLPDGTQVMLNAGSQLKFPRNFSGKTREVFLTGEGFFDVTKNKKKPFLVQTSDITIKVLGTAFNVKSYPEEGTIETTLIRGAVTISGRGPERAKMEKLYLKPDQKATFIRKTGKIMDDGSLGQYANSNVNRKEQLILNDKVNTELEMAWMNNKLIFKNETFESLIVKLERWYNVDIQVTDKDFLKYHYDGVIENETINEVMEIIKPTMNFNYTINHNKIVISKAAV